MLFGPPSQYRTVPGQTDTAVVDFSASLEAAPGMKRSYSSASSNYVMNDLQARKRSRREQPEQQQQHKQQLMMQQQLLMMQPGLMVAAAMPPQHQQQQKMTLAHQYQYHQRLIPPKKSVRFNTQIQLIVVDDHQNTATAADSVPSPTAATTATSCCWYNRNDYREFREDARATALSVQLGITDWIEPGDFCSLGLEAHVSPREGAMRRLKRLLLIQTILQEQLVQRTMTNRNNNRGLDHDKIREISTILSADALLDAVKRALQQDN